MLLLLFSRLKCHDKINAMTSSVSTTAKAMHTFIKRLAAPPLSSSSRDAVLVLVLVGLKSVRMSRYMVHRSPLQTARFERIDGRDS